MERCWLGLEAAKCRHVFGLLAGDAPVVGLVDRLVMFPGRFVVDGESLDRLCGKCLKLDGNKKLKRGKRSPLSPEREKLHQTSHPDVDHCIGSITLQRVELQVTLKVARVQSRDGKAVPITSLQKPGRVGLRELLSLSWSRASGTLTRGAAREPSKLGRGAVE